MAMTIVEAHPEKIMVNVFADSQAAIKALKCMRQQSGQYTIHPQTLAQRNWDCGKTSRMQWLQAHVGIPGNEAADKAAKEAT